VAWSHRAEASVAISARDDVEDGGGAGDDKNEDDDDDDEGDNGDDEEVEEKWDDRRLTDGSGGCKDLNAEVSDETDEDGTADSNAGISEGGGNHNIPAAAENGVDDEDDAADAVGSQMCICTCTSPPSLISVEA
jgi:hypothetical protein